MSRIFLLIILLSFSISLNAQVKGIVIDSATNTPVDKAVIGLVIKSKPTDTSYVLTNEKGEFNFEVVPSSNYSIIISTMGYRPVAKYVPVPKALKSIDLGKIIIVSVAKVLGEVVIESAPITIKEDTIEYRADAFKVKENASVEDLLKKLPGIQVDKDGNIKAQGKNVTKVKVNGKDFFGGDPKTATRELPANIVDKVQVVDDYGDQANVTGIKEGEPDKVINIQLKKDKSQGYFGRATAGVGTKDRYLASFNGNYFNKSSQISLFTNANNTNQSLFNFGGASGASGMANRGLGSLIKMGQGMMNDMGGSSSIMNAMNNGDIGFLQSGSTGSEGVTASQSIGVNYRDQWSKKIGVYGSYSFSHRNNKGYKITSQQNIFPQGNFINDQDNQFVNKGDNHRFFLNFEYQVDSFNYFKISPNISYATSNSTSNTLFDYFDGNNAKTSDGYNNRLSNSTTPNVNGSVLYNHKFRKRGRNFSANLNAGTSGNESVLDSRNNTSTYITPAGSLSRFLFTDQDNDNHNYGIRFTYSEPLSRIRALDIIVSHNFSYSRNNKKTFDINAGTGVQTLNSLLSNDYENDYYVSRANITVRTTQKKYNYTLGVTVQPVNLKGISLTKDSAYRPINRVNVFPVARLAYNFTKFKTINFSYSGSAQQPGFSQLQDVVDATNAPYLTRGNPNLKPAINHNINASFNNFNLVTGKVLFTNLSFMTSRNRIVNNIIRLGSSGAQLSIPENVNGFYNTNAFYTWSRPYKNRRYVLSLNGTLNYNHNISLIDSQKIVGNNWIVSQGLMFEWNQKEWLEFGAGINYNLNSINYNTKGNAVTGLQNQDFGSWMFSSNISIDITKTLIVKYDIDYTVNNGLNGTVAKNPAILNVSLEKQLFKKKNGILRLQAFDIFDQNSNISRSVSANSIIDSRSNRLTRYFMLGFTYKVQKFKGQPQQKPRGLGDLLKMGPGQ